MQTLTKTQVIALFLGAASADLLTNLNALSSADTVPEEQTLKPSNTGTECNGNADCTAEGERCMKIQFVTADAQNLCLSEDYCGMMGRYANDPFIGSCWSTPAEGEVAEQPSDVADIATYFTELEDLITKETVNFDGDENIIISPKFNWMDGWFILNTEGDNAGKWVETDKSPDNRCFLDVQCPPDNCCMFWPDQLNRRCKERTLDMQMMTAGPAAFTPNCPGSTVDDAVPENAQDDIAQGALSEAEEALTSFANNRKTDAKDDDDYDNLSAEAQAAWDEDWAAKEAKIDEWKDELKALAGFSEDDCDIACQVIVEEKILEAEKAIYDYCNDDDTKNKVDCAEGEELSKKQWAALGKEYFTSDEDARALKDQEWTDAKDAEKANIIALAPKPDAGAEGGACGGEADIKCGAETMCCGSRYAPGAAWAEAADDEDDLVEGVVDAVLGTEDNKRRVGQEDNLCGPVATEDGANAGYTGAFDLQYIHVCDAAVKFAVSVAAAGAAVFYM